MAYVIGFTLALGVAAFARLAGFDRDRAFYSTVLLIVGSYYVLFAVVSGDMQAVVVETIGLSAFALAAVLGLRGHQVIVIAGLAAHGVFDAFHGHLIVNPGVPQWWPAFCGTYDVVAAACLAFLVYLSPGKRVESVPATH